VGGIEINSRWTSRLNVDVVWTPPRRRMPYRTLQILHGRLSDFFHYFVPIFFPIVSIIVIFAIFISIHSRASLNFLTQSILISTAGTCMFWIYINCELCKVVTKLSAIFCRRNPGRLIKSQEERQLCSCRPLKFKVGETLYVTNSTFPNVVHLTIVNVINLLVLTKKKI